MGVSVCVVESVSSGCLAEAGTLPRQAGVAQLVEQLIRNQQVVSSSLTAGSIFPNKRRDSKRQGRSASAVGSIWAACEQRLDPRPRSGGRNWAERSRLDHQGSLDTS